MKYILGVDGGGTKTETIAYDMQGKEVTKSINGFGNMVTDREEALKNIMLSIENCISAMGEAELKGIYLGIAGVEAGNNKEILSKEIKNRFKVHHVIMNDGELAMKAMLKGSDGILVISGTGSIVFGTKNNLLVKSGGWGYILGDEGSGYHIGLEALRKIVYEDDCGIEKSKFSMTILEKLNMKEVNEILDFTYPVNKEKIAAITPIVNALAEEGDKLAKEILIKEGTELAKGAELVYKKLNFKDGCVVAIKGSVVERVRLLREAFENYLHTNLKNINIINEDISPAIGAYYCYCMEDNAK